MPYITKFDGQADKITQIGGEGNPSSIEGYFLGTKNTESEFGPGKLHIFQTPEGTVGVWGKTRSNNLLTDDVKGQMCLLTFTGMVAPAKKGRRPSYGYKLQHDPENTIDVQNINLGGTTQAEEIDDNDSEDDTTEAYSRPAEVKTPPRAPSQQSQDRVQALLNKGKTARTLA